MLKKIALLTILGVIVGMTGACGTSGDTKTYEFLVTQSADLQDGQPRHHRANPGCKLVHPSDGPE